MAGDRDPWPLWAQEATGTSGRPTGQRVLLVAAALILLAPLVGAYERRSQAVEPERPPSLCEQHAGRPGWSSVCSK